MQVLIFAANDPCTFPPHYVLRLRKHVRPAFFPSLVPSRRFFVVAIQTPSSLDLVLFGPTNQTLFIDYIGTMYDSLFIKKGGT